MKSSLSYVIKEEKKNNGKTVINYWSCIVMNRSKILQPQVCKTVYISTSSNVEDFLLFVFIKCLESVNLEDDVDNDEAGS